MRNSFESFQAVKAADRHVPVYQGVVPTHIIERSEAAKARALETAGAPV